MPRSVASSGRNSRQQSSANRHSPPPELSDSWEQMTPSKMLELYRKGPTVKSVTSAVTSVFSKLSGSKKKAPAQKGIELKEPSNRPPKKTSSYQGKGKGKAAAVEVSSDSDDDENEDYNEARSAHLAKGQPSKAHHSDQHDDE